MKDLVPRQCRWPPHRRFRAGLRRPSPWRPSSPGRRRRSAPEALAPGPAQLLGSSRVGDLILSATRYLPSVPQHVCCINWLLQQVRVDMADQSPNGLRMVRRSVQRHICRGVRTEIWKHRRGCAHARMRSYSRRRGQLTIHQIKRRGEGRRSCSCQHWRRGPGEAGPPAARVASSAILHSMTKHATNALRAVPRILNRMPMCAPRGCPVGS